MSASNAKHPASHYAAVALVYKVCELQGNRGPLMVIAAQFNVPQTTAAAWVKRCREQGLLPRTARPGVWRADERMKWAAADLGVDPDEPADRPEAPQGPTLTMRPENANVYVNSIRRSGRGGRT